MKSLDTNVLVRYLVQDDKRQAAAASQFIESECSPESPCFIGHIVMCELAWVLESNYRQGRAQVAQIIEGLLEVAELEVLEPEVVWRALRDYQHSNIDFPDHLLARVNESRRRAPTVTFDRKAARDPLFELLG